MIDFALLVLAFNPWPLVQGFVMTLFVLVSILMVLVILLQEGKGGGIAGAFGGAAAESFGVKAGTVNRFTAILATIFICLALVHAGIAAATGGSVVKPVAPTPVVLPPAGPSVAPPEAPGSPDGAGMTDGPAMTDTPGMTEDGPGEGPAMTEPPPAMDEGPAMTETPPAMDGTPPPAPAPEPAPAPAPGAPPPETPKAPGGGQ